MTTPAELRTLELELWASLERHSPIRVSVRDHDEGAMARWYVPGNNGWIQCEIVISSKAFGETANITKGILAAAGRLKK